MEALAKCLAEIPMSALAKLVLQASSANGLMLACLNPALMAVPVSLWPTSSPAYAQKASQDRSVTLTSMSVKFRDSANMAAPASTCQVPTNVSAPRVSQASTVTAPMCPAHLPPVPTEAPADRLVISLLNATVFQGLKELLVRGILMTAQTTSVRMEESVWMESILITAAVLLSGQDSSAQRMWMSACCNPTPARMGAPVPTVMATIVACASMAGQELIAVRTLMTAPLPPALRVLLALIVWPPSLACAQKEKQVSYVI